jgi:predicted Zn-dependent protease
MRETRSTLTLSCLLLSLLSTACGNIHNSSTTSTLTTDCILSPDQGGTLSGRWVKPAVQIAFHAGDWNSSEIQAMTTAADSWNNFFAMSMGYPAINYKNTDGTIRTSTTGLTNNSQVFCSDSSQSILDSNSNFIGSVVIYKDGSWSYGTDIIALTTTCRNATAATQLPRFHNAYMEVNYANFFVNGNRVPDLQSIVLHEMGHLMGINHSCETSSSAAGVPICSSSLPGDYLHASMYPTFKFSTSGLGETRRSLNVNDEGRMNCVYKYL